MFPANVPAKTVFPSLHKITSLSGGIFPATGTHLVRSSASRIVRYASLAPGMGVLSAWRWSHVLASSIVIRNPTFFRHLPVRRDIVIHNTAPFIVDKTTIVAIWFLGAVSAQPLKCSFNTTSHIFPSITQRFSAAWAYPERLAATGGGTGDGDSHSPLWLGGTLPPSHPPGKTWP